MRGLIVGRDAELASVREFVASVSDGAAALVLQGEAGVGKTTVWAAGVDEAEAAGLRVARASPAEGETALSYSGLADLLDPLLDEVLDGLPELQRRALSHALVRERDDRLGTDARAIGTAALGALRLVAATDPVLVAIDDVQWLDAESGVREVALHFRRSRLEDAQSAFPRRLDAREPERRLPDACLALEDEGPKASFLFVEEGVQDAALLIPSDDFDHDPPRDNRDTILSL